MTNPLYDIFNKPYIAANAEKHHREQIKHVQDAIKNLHDFLDSMDKIEIEYKDAARGAVCAVLLEYLSKKN